MGRSKDEQLLASAMPQKVTKAQRHTIKQHWTRGPSGVVGEVTLPAQGHQKLLLGDFTADSPPKGFVIELTSDPEPTGSVTTQIACVGTAKRYRLVLHATNYGTKTIRATVRQL